MRAIVLFFFISGMLTACGGDDKVPKSGGVSNDKLEIVTSIKPIQAIVLAITADAANVTQLIPDFASPHDYSFKPSDIRKVKNADIVFRIDEHMETQLNGVLDNVDSDKISVISLADANGLTMLGAGDTQHNHGHDDRKDSNDHDSGHDPDHEKEKKNHEHQDHSKNEDQHGHKHDHNDGHEEHSSKHDDHDKHKEHNSHSDHGNVDFHVWTSPKNAVLMANHIAINLSHKDAKNAKQYQENIGHFFEKVKTESEKIVIKLAPFKNKPYIVFHNSWQYFAAEFGLQKPIVIDLHEGVSSGAKTISDIRERIVKENINCVFYDSGISLARLNVISEKAKTVEIDVLAKDIALDQSTYINWLEQLGNQIESCLSE